MAMLILIYLNLAEGIRMKESPSQAMNIGITVKPVWINLAAYEICSGIWETILSTKRDHQINVEGWKQKQTSQAQEFSLKTKNTEPQPGPSRIQQNEKEVEPKPGPSGIQLRIDQGRLRKPTEQEMELDRIQDEEPANNIPNSYQLGEISRYS